MTLLTLYLITAIVFLGLDALGLRYLVAPVFRQQVGDWLYDSPKLAPAAAFYLFYVAGLLYFVSIPALAHGPGRAFITGAFFGALAYGTYEFTNLATLTRWSWSMVATDLAWGTVLTGTAAATGVWAVRALGL